MAGTHYAAVTGDLVASRKVPAGFRVKLQQETLKVLGELNEKMGNDLARPAVLTAGDEVQALFRVPSLVVQFMQVIQDRIHASTTRDQDIVFGVGWGALSTGLLPEATGVEQLDGTCFHHARETLALAKKKKTWAVFQGFGRDDDRILTTLFQLMGAVRAGWTRKQSWYTVEIRELGKRIDVARRNGVSPSVITESLQQSHFDAIMNGEQTARGILQHYDPGSKVPGA